MYANESLDRQQLFTHDFLSKGESSMVKPLFPSSLYTVVKIIKDWSAIRFIPPRPRSKPCGLAEALNDDTAPCTTSRHLYETGSQRPFHCEHPMNYGPGRIYMPWTSDFKLN